MTKEEIYVKNLNKRVKVDANKEIDHDHYLAIMDSMEEYKGQGTYSEKEVLDLLEKLADGTISETWLNNWFNKIK